MDLPEKGFAVYWILFTSWSTGWITGKIAGLSGQIFLTVNEADKTVVKSDLFHYHIIV